MRHLKVIAVMSVVCALIPIISSCCGKSAGDDFVVYDTITRSQLMQMSQEEYVTVWKKMSPENKAKVYQIKLEDVLHNWNLQGEELQLAKSVSSELSEGLFNKSDVEAESSSDILYKNLFENGDECTRCRLFLAFEKPQTLDELKTLIKRDDYQKWYLLCQKDPQMKSLLGL